MTHPTRRSLLHALTAAETDAQFRWHLYDKILDEIVDRIFFEKNAGVDFWYYIYPIPARYQHEIQDFQHYAQEECCEYIAKALRKEGFYTRTLQHNRSLFISWHPTHLQQMREEQKQQAAKQKQMDVAGSAPTSNDASAPPPAPHNDRPAPPSDTQSNEWARVKTKAKIQLQGGKHQLQSNRVKLANFFLR